ncbi:hypothetical protein [Hymenobacter sp. B1770]|uniref:hypothetical protein n=1 Tax=Hymenobacter sp. B1770 TaxID=1718788 RepID=UPI003CFB19DD
MATPAPAQLLFLSCRLSAEALGTRVEVLQMEAVAGELRTAPADADTPDFVRVSQLNRQGKSLAQAMLPHPLRRSVEHVGDDHRTFQRSELVLPTAEFFVRLALRPDAVTIRIEESTGGKTALLTDLPIPPKS